MSSFVQNDRQKLCVSEDHKNTANPILILCTVFLHLRTFGLEVIQLILASKLSDIEFNFTAMKTSPYTFFDGFPNTLKSIVIPLN